MFKIEPPGLYEEKSILPKSYDKETGMIRFKTGLIPGRSNYALRKDGSVIRTQPNVMTGKERRRDKRIQAEHPVEGFRFICTCRKVTFHFPSHKNVKIKGYEKLQRMETYKCSLCEEHFDRAKIDAAVAAYEDKKEKEAADLQKKP